MPNKTESTEKTANPTLAKVVDDFNSSWEYTQSTYHDLWLDCWNLYNNRRIDKGYQGISNTFVPMTFSTIETMVAALAGSRPRFDFQPTRPEQETDTKVLNYLLDHYWELDKWQSKVDRWIRSMLMYGTGVMYVYWDIDHPCIINVPLRDFFVDPTATSPADARFMGRRFLTSKEDLASYEYVDAETGEIKKVYKNLNRIRSNKGGNTGDETDKEKKDLYIGSTLGKQAQDKQVEVIEYWTPDRVIAVANRSVVIRDEENPHMSAAKARGDENPQGLLPFIIQRNYVDESLFYGKGEIEPVMKLQEMLNDLSNQNIDAITYQLNPMYTLDPKYADWTDKVESLPGAVYPFEASALVPVNMGNISSDAFNERLNIKNEIREATASDQVTKGVSDETNATATEIRAQVAQAGQRFAIKVSQIENEGYYDLAQTVLEMVQLYVTEPMMVKIIGNNQGIDWAIYDPGIYNGEFDVKVQLESTVEAQKDQDANQSKELFLAFNGDPLINQKELRRIALMKGFDLEPDEVDDLLTVEDPLMGDPLAMQDPLADPLADPMADPMAALPLGAEPMPADIGALL